MYGATSDIASAKSLLQRKLHNAIHGYGGGSQGKPDAGGGPSPQNPAAPTS
jgi:hypothetical protein